MLSTPCWIGMRLTTNQYSHLDTAVIVTDVREEGGGLACSSTKAETDDGGQFFSSISTQRYAK